MDNNIKAKKHDKSTKNPIQSIKVIKTTEEQDSNLVNGQGVKVGFKNGQRGGLSNVQGYSIQKFVGTNRENPVPSGALLRSWNTEEQLVRRPEGQSGNIEVKKLR